ncbi:MAG TPA: DHHA1 domain-containing protein, partial [Candidatus Sulfotelmatobacter sp.]|nr:DHHA1 domain-containing protein [Candidatus Sulfotelmatobacter sp.]
GAVDWVDPQAAATCEMTTLLAGRLGVPLDAAGGQLAASLVAGLVIDTATFQHPNTTPRTLRVAAELVAAGAPLSETSRRIYRTKSDHQLRLFGRVLARLEERADGRLVWSRLEDADLAATGSGPADSEGLIDLMSQSASGDVVILFKEAGDQTRLSIRTREGGVDATRLAGTWGGGGHARASGATVPVPLADAPGLVLPVAERLLAERPSA